jgi:hypothetical protein
MNEKHIAAAPPVAMPTPWALASRRQFRISMIEILKFNEYTDTREWMQVITTLLKGIG